MSMADPSAFPQQQQHDDNSHLPPGPPPPPPPPVPQQSHQHQQQSQGGPVVPPPPHHQDFSTAADEDPDLHQHHDHEAVAGVGVGGKRKRQSEGPGSRSKRSRYISIACNECKRRKIKCNGQMPCQRCGNLQLECVYAPNCCSGNFRDTTEFKQMTQHIFALQDQLDGLWHTVNHLRALAPQHDAISMPPPPPPRDMYTGSYGDARALSAEDDVGGHDVGGHDVGVGVGGHDVGGQDQAVSQLHSTQLNIDPSLNPHARGAQKDSVDHPSTGQSSADTTTTSTTTNNGDHHHHHHPAHQGQTHAPATQRYTPASATGVNVNSAPDASASSRLSYELARASMESMGIAAARSGHHSRPHHLEHHAHGDDDTSAEAAAVAAAAAAAAAAGDETRGNGEAGDPSGEPDHQRALAELLHNAELQQQLQAAGAAAGAPGGGTHVPARQTGGDGVVKNE